MKKSLKNMLTIAVPLLPMGLMWCLNKYVLTGVTILAIYLFIGLIDTCRRYENLWLFVLVGIATVPMNLMLTMVVCDDLCVTWNRELLAKIVFFPIVYGALFSMEEIVLGIIGRVIWKEQENLFFDKAENERRGVV